MRGRRIDCNELAAQIRALVIKSVGPLSDNYSVSGMVSRYLRSRRYGGSRAAGGSRARRRGRGGRGFRSRQIFAQRSACLRALSRHSRTHPARHPLQHRWPTWGTDTIIITVYIVVTHRSRHFALTNLAQIRLADYFIGHQYRETQLRVQESRTGRA